MSTDLTQLLNTQRNSPKFKRLQSPMAHDEMNNILTESCSKKMVKFNSHRASLAHNPNQIRMLHASPAICEPPLSKPALKVLPKVEKTNLPAE